MTFFFGLARDIGKASHAFVGLIHGPPSCG